MAGKPSLRTLLQSLNLRRMIINTRTNEAEARSVEREAQALGKLVVAGTAGKLSTIEKMKRRAEGAFGRVDIYVSSAA